MKWVFLFLLSFVFSNANSQQLFYQDQFIGGVTAGGYSPSYSTGGTGNFNIDISPGSTIRKAYLMAGRHGKAAPVTVTLNGINFTFDNSNQVSPTFQSSVYGGNSGVHAIDVTASINPTVNNYTLAVPNVSGPQARFNDFYLLVAYDNASLALTNVAVYVNTNNLQMSATWNITLPFAANVSSDLGASFFCGYACSMADGETVFVNGTSLGTFGGNDYNSGNCGGPIGSFYYRNNTLTGTGDDKSDQAVNGPDNLSNLKNLLAAGAINFNLRFDHANSKSDNAIWAAVIINGTSSCPPVVASRDTTICSGSSVQLACSGGSAYSWTPVLGLNNPSIANPVATPTVTTTYYCTASQGACSGADSVIVNVNQSVTAGILISNNDFCEGETISISFSGTAPLGSVYNWNFAGGNIISGSSQGPYSVRFNSPGTKNISITLTNGICTKSDSKQIQVNQIPIVSGDTSICFGNSAPLLCSGGNTFTWLPVTGLNSSTIANPIATPSVTTTYFCSSTTGTCTTIDSVIVTVIKNIIAGISMNKVKICSGETILISFSGTAPANSVFNWSFDDGNIISGSGEGPYSVEFNSPGSKNISLDVNFGSCSSSDTKGIQVYPSPTVSFTVDPTSGCEPLTVNFTNNSSQGFFKWRIGNSIFPTTQNPSVVLNNGTYDVSLIVTTSDGCMDSLLEKNLIRVFRQPVADFSVTPDVNIDVLLKDASFSFTNLSQRATAYYWTFGDQTNSSEANPTHTYLKPGNYVVKLTAFDSECMDVATKEFIRVISNYDIYIPNAFSPNGDGINDDFNVIGAAVTDFTISIYNRWGENVFTTKDLSAGWNGKFKGLPCLAGAYAYSASAIFINGEKKNYKGSVTILR